VPVPVPLRGVIAFVDRALDPRTATRNARHAAADLSEQLRQIHEVERELRLPVPDARGSQDDATTSRVVP